MARKTKPRPKPNWSKFEIAGMAVCRSVYRTCACEDGRAPSVCQSMETAAFSVVACLMPDRHEALFMERHGIPTKDAFKYAHRRAALAAEEERG